MYIITTGSVYSLALLRCSISWGHGGPGGLHFYREIAMAKFEIFFLGFIKIKSREGSIQKSFLLHFCFIINFRKICRIVSSAFSLQVHMICFTTSSGYNFYDFFSFATHLLIFTNLWIKKHVHFFWWKL